LKKNNHREIKVTGRYLMGNSLREVESQVLANYTKHSPSKLPLEDDVFRQKHFSKRRELFQDRLKMPLSMFDSKKILDFGCGTGEQTITYASWGGVCTGVDINEISVKQTETYFSMFGLKDKLHEIHTKSLFDFSTEEKYDIIVSEGVLHHTADPKRGFDVAAGHLVDGGFIVLQLAFDTSHMQRSMQRLVLDFLTSGNENDIAKVSEQLFHRQIERAQKFGGRTAESIIYDFYTQPKHKGVSVYEILEWFEQHNIQYYSSYPMIDVGGLIDGLHKKPSNKFIVENLFTIAFNNLIFMIASDDDGDEINGIRGEGVQNMDDYEAFFEQSMLRDYEYGDKENILLENTSKALELYLLSSKKLFNKRNKQVQNKIDTFMREFNLLIDAVKTKNIDIVSAQIDSFCVLFSGYQGVPSNYITGYKKS
jgi:SAM-dependent methyltransferase